MDKRYVVVKSGGCDIAVIYATCITKAAIKFMAPLPKEAKLELYSSEHGSITYKDNHTIMSDFIITQRGRGKC